jgi:hypothetical protein
MALLLLLIEYANSDGMMSLILPPTLQLVNPICHPLISLFKGNLAGILFV